MKQFEVNYTNEARKALRKMDPPQSKLILKWIDKNLAGCENPRALGEGLDGPLSQAWKYRVGKYRVIVDIVDSKVVVHVLAVGHRRDVYEKIKRKI